MEKIYHQKQLIGIRIKSFARGSRPISGEKEPLQILTLKQKAGACVTPHFHVPKKRITDYSHECLIVRKGRIRVDIYSLEKKFLKRIFLGEGSALILMSGGCSVKFLEDSEIFEIKNGPFIDDRINI